MLKHFEIRNQGRFEMVAENLTNSIKLENVDTL